MKHVSIMKDLQPSFNYMKTNDRIKGIKEKQKLSSLSECTSEAMTSLAIAVDQEQKRDGLVAQTTIETARMWNALYFYRCYKLEWSTKFKELEEIENKRKARYARKMASQRKGDHLFINER